MNNFEVLFDRSETGVSTHAAYRRYGRVLGFPSPPPDRPWIFSNFVQSLDGIASFLGKYALGSHISRSAEDRWLMDLLRVHADAILLGLGTLVAETALVGSGGPVYKAEDAELLELRQQLGRGRQCNIFVTGSGNLDVSGYSVFDGRRVDTAIVTTRRGAERLRAMPAHVRVITAGEDLFVDLPQAMALLHEQMAIRHLLCEGGPTLSGYLSHAGLVDERFLTISPIEVGQVVPTEQPPSELEKGNPPRLRPTTFQAPGFMPDDAPWWTWLSCRRVGDHQFNRYRRQR